MNKKGFTLVEVLAVIILLGLISLIAVPTVRRMIKSSKQKLYDEQISLIEDGLKNWASANIFLLPEENQTIKLSLGQLKQAGYLEPKITNPTNNQCFSNESILSITKYNNSYIYKIDKIIDVDCSLIEDTPTIKLNGNVVEYLKSGETYEDAGATAKDSNGKDITSKITITTSSIGDDVAADGSYNIIYSVTNNGKTMTAIRTIFAELPEIEIMFSDSECIKSEQVICPNGTEVSVKVNDNQTYNFYVINDTGSKLTLIMDRNLGETVAWYKDNNDNTFDERNNLGPITALTYLNSQTSTWKYIPVINNYTYINNLDGITDLYGYQKLEIKNGKAVLLSQDGTSTSTVSGISKARLLTREEEDALTKLNDDIKPTYLYTNLSASSITTGLPYAYWFLTTRPRTSLDADSINCYGYKPDLANVNDYSSFGIRPVIELSK